MRKFKEAQLCVNPLGRALRPVPKSNETKLLMARAVATLKPSDRSIHEIYVM
jgi:hypothetical protein